MNNDNTNNLDRENKEKAIDVALEEYKTLRAEILMLQQNCNNLLVFGFAAVVTLIGIALTPLSKVPIQEAKTTPANQTEINNNDRVTSNIPSAIILCAIVPLSCGCLTIVCLKNDKKIYWISKHIANKIENKINHTYLELKNETEKPLTWERDRQNDKLDLKDNKSIVILFGLIALSSSVGGAAIVTAATVNYYLNVFWLPSLISLLYFISRYFSQVDRIDPRVTEDEKNEKSLKIEARSEPQIINLESKEISTKSEENKEKLIRSQPEVKRLEKVDLLDLLSQETIKENTEKSNEPQTEVAIPEKVEVEDEIQDLTLEDKKQSESIIETKSKVKSKPFFLKPTTLILVVLALILGGVVYYSETKTDNQQETVQKKQKKLFAFTEADIKNLKIEKETETIELERTNDPTKPWQMKQPDKVPASDAVVSYLSNLLVNGQSDRSFIIPPNQKQDYGLDKPLAKVNVQLTNQNTHEVILGNPNFDNQFLYAEVDPPTDSNKDIEIFLIPIDFQYAVERKIEEWKEKDVTPKKEESKPTSSPSPQATTSPSSNQSPKPKQESDTQSKETPKPFNSQSPTPKLESDSQSKETPKPEQTNETKKQVNISPNTTPTPPKND
jgi:hypothetical protein